MNRYLYRFCCHSVGTSTYQPLTLGETEIIKNCLNPRWNKKFYLNYKPGSKPTYFLVKIFNKKCENKFKELASGVFDIDSILQMPDNRVTKKLKNGVGSIDVRVEKVVGVGSLQLKLSGTSLKPVKKGFRSKIRPFYQFSRKDVGPSGPEWNVVYSSEDIGSNSPSPIWEEEHIDLGRLCYNDADLTLRLSILHNRSSGKHSLIGEVETSVNALIAASKSSSRLQISNNGAVTGRLNVLSASLSIAERSNAFVGEETVRSSLCLDVEEGDIFESLSSVSTCPAADVPSTPCESLSTSRSTPISTPTSVSAP